MMTKRIIIVGATSGIGRSMAERYAQQGHRVGITGRRLELLTELQQAFPKNVEYECFDVTGNENIPRLHAMVNKLNGMDLLVISAGNGETSKELNWEIDKTTVKTNVNGFVEIANWAFNYFVAQGSGQLATISSIAAIRGNSWAPAYSAGKAFQSNYFEGLSIKARKLKKDVSVTCIEPGFVKTKMARSNKIFWLVPLDKATTQIISAIDKKKRKAYISHRWWIIAQLLKWMPYSLLKRMV